MKPLLAAAAATTATDEDLVAAIRAGNDEALEALFRRYRDKITLYVRGMVADHGRSEDIVQETFISALRNLRSGDRQIIFRPWIYQIARNACIDQLRRQRRAEEISFDSDDFKPHHEGRLSEATPSTDNAVSQREDMHALREAFGGLPASQHEVLVLREFAGLSYAEIAHRMNLSPAAVESVLFRARRGLKDEYDEIATGERCLRMQGIIAALAEGVGHARDRRALVRHIGDCAGCRHEAAAMGLGALLRRRGRVRKALDRAAALLPIPPFLRRRSTAVGHVPPAQVGGRAQSVWSNVASMAGPGVEQATFASKAVAALVTAALVGGGALVGQKSATGSDLPSAPASHSGSILGAPTSPQAPGGPASGLATGAASGPLGSLGGPSLSVERSASAFSGSLVPSSIGSDPALSGAGGQGGGLVGGIPAGGGQGSPALPEALQSPGAEGVPRTTLPTRSGALPPLSAPSLPRLGGGSGSGGGSIGGGSTGGGSPRLPDRPSLPVTPPRVSRPSLPSAPSAPVVPSTPVSPSAPAEPPAPSVLSVPSLPPVSTVTGTLQSTPAGAGPALPAAPVPGP